MPVYHEPVMAEEIMEFLQLRPGMLVVDGTIGEGGHACRIAMKINPGGMLIGIDRDPSNLDQARRRLELSGADFRLFQGPYSGVRGALRESGCEKADCILLDLGFSMRHIKAAGRGFSFMADDVLDMRYDVSSGRPAYEWLSEASGEEIAYVLRRYGDEKAASVIAGEIKRRESGKAMTSRELADIVTRVKKPYGRIHPATKTFQAVRIFINDEIDELKRGLAECLSVLAQGGRFAVLTYHSLEDRIVKKFFAAHTGRCKCPPGFPVCICDAAGIRPLVALWKFSGKTPDAEEIRSNPSSRSARLRGCEVLKAA